MKDVNKIYIYLVNQGLEIDLKINMYNLLILNDMKVFISWSSNSIEIGKTLKYLINSIWKDKIQVFISEEDLTQGEFFGQICEEIKKSDLLIACFTQENKLNPWIYFEAAIMMISKPNNVIPFCYGLDVSETKMLNRCQGVKYDVLDEQKERALEKLLDYVNNIVSEISKEDFIPKHILHQITGKYIKKAIRKLDLINELNKPYNYFISYPIKGTTENLKKRLERVKVRLEKEDNKIKIFHAVGQYEQGSEVETYDTLGTISESKHFILVLPLDVSISSVFVEIGAAISLKKTITILREANLEGEKSYLPFILKKKIRDKRITLIEYHSDELDDKLFDYIRDDSLLNK